MDGATVKRTFTDGKDIFIETLDKRVFVFTAYRGYIILGQGTVVEGMLK